MLVLLRGAAIAVPSLMRRIEADALDRGAHSVVDWTLTGWDEDPEGVTARFETPDGPAESRANRLILALGPGFLAFETLRSLRLHCVKGQLVRVRSDATPAIMRAVSSNGYVVPQSDGSLVVGSTYEHTFPDGEPKRIVSHNLLSMAETALPWIRGAEILEEAAGIRVTVPGIRLPMVGPLPGHARTWVLTGLGSKGLLMAPYIAERLHGWLQDPASIPSDLRVRTDDS
jgi:glycine/D-amino acid oxidase-like deaminating enzyme